MQRPDEQIDVDIPVDQLPLRIAAIQVEGIEHTSPKLPIAYLQILNDTRSVAQLNASLKVVSNHMMQSGLYNDLEFAVLPGSESREFSSDVRVYCQVKERNRYRGEVGISQSPDTNSTVLKLGGSMLNPINGFGETLQVSFATDATRREFNSYNISLNDVYNNINSKIKYHVGIERSQYSREEVSGFTARSDRFCLGGTTYDDHSSIEYELALRRATPTANAPEYATVTKTYEPNLKSTVRYTVRSDTRDIPYNPTRGELLTASGEVSGLIGDFNGLRGQLSYQKHLPISASNPDAALHMTFHSGVQVPFRTLLSLATNANPENTHEFDSNQAYPDVPITDRFYPTQFWTRGLKLNEYGPKAGRHVFGGDIFATGTLSASAPIPNLPDIPLRPHIFTNATAIGSMSTMLRERYMGSNRGVTQPFHVSASTGIGLVCPLAIGRIELNLASQIKAAKLMKPKFAFVATLDW